MLKPAWISVMVRPRLVQPNSLKRIESFKGLGQDRRLILISICFFIHPRARIHLDMVRSKASRLHRCFTTMWQGNNPPRTNKGMCNCLHTKLPCPPTISDGPFVERGDTRF